MESEVANTEIGAAINQIVAGFNSLHEAGFDPANARDAITLTQEIEHVRRLADHASISVMSAIDDRRYHLGDGHSSAKSMVRHHAKLSNGEAAARERTMKLIDTCPDIGEAYQSGSLGTDQIRSLSLLHSNPRIRHLMPDRQDWFLDKAKTMNHTDFDARINRWKRLVDQDGPTPPNERAHQDRNARITQNFDTTWDLVANFASMQGLQTYEIFDHYLDAETRADWEKARAEHGDNTTAEHLPRTTQQRRADALWQIFIDAAANPNSAMPADFMHNIMWDHQTFEEMAEQFFGAAADHPHDTDDPDHPDDIEELQDRNDAAAPQYPRDCIKADSIGCQTLNGIPVDPTEMFAMSIVGRIRRVLIDAKSMVIDQGTARSFTGAARHAVKLSHTRCVWPGCCTPSSKCESDHLLEHSRQGRTNPDNGAPLCGKHNRWKQKGFTIWRDPTGTWHTLRPDGTEIPN